MPNHPKPITIRGITYRSKADAAKALGITYESLRKAVVDGRLDTVGLNPRGKNHGRKVHFNGKRYPSIAAAARATGVHYETMRDYVRK